MKKLLACAAVIIVGCIGMELFFRFTPEGIRLPALAFLSVAMIAAVPFIATKTD
jgi:hypothetical protein